jgi:hypothetical protein
MKLFKRSTKKAVSEYKVKAHLIGLGSGSLEFANNSLRFYINKGRIRKQQQLVREIEMEDVREVDLEGKELSITWKESHDIFILDDVESSDALLGKVLTTSKELKKASENEIIVKPQSDEVRKILSVGMDITDFLFDILRSLNGYVDWDNVEDLTNKSAHRLMEVRDQEISFLELDFSNLKLAVNERVHQEVTKEILDLLKIIYNYFVNAESENTNLRDIHPNFSDAKTTIQACYILNDIALSSILTDEDAIQEQTDLLMTLKDLGKMANLKININSVKAIINKLCKENGKENLIIRSRKIFRNQLNGLILN